MLHLNNFFFIWTVVAQAKWIFKVILGEIDLPSEDEMKADIEKWLKK